MWSNVKQRRGRIVSYFANFFSSFMITKCSSGESENVVPPSFNLQKRHSSPLQFAQKENIPRHSIERGAYLFTLKIVRVFPTPTSKNKMMNIFIRVNMIPTCKKFYRIGLGFFIPKRPSFSQFDQEQNIHRPHLKEELTNLFSKLPGHSLSPHRHSNG